jgi:tetratricopeptide (TPR) repeat protein
MTPTAARQAALIEEAIGAAREDDFLRALTIFIDVYGNDDKIGTHAERGQRPFVLRPQSRARAQGDEAGHRSLPPAIELEFYNGDHYANLARVYAAAGNRKKAIATAEQGLKLAPEHEYLQAVRKSFGVRSEPYVPFLGRTNPINVSLGQARHAKKVAEKERKQKS